MNILQHEDGVDVIGLTRRISPQLRKCKDIHSIAMRSMAVTAITSTLVLGSGAAATDKAPQTAEDINCRLIDQAARDNRLSAAILTRLIWTESRFNANAVSAKGAQGIAQFMPATTSDRGLSDPFDPQQAVPHAARLLADLGRQLGNVGLAVAAYNAGPDRVGKWLGKKGTLPRETQAFVIAVTGRSAEQWVASDSYAYNLPLVHASSCSELKSALRDLAFNSFAWYRGRITPAIWESDLMLPILWTSGRPLPVLRQSGRMVPGTESGRPLPILRQSGRMLPGMEQSGRPLFEIHQRAPHQELAPPRKTADRN